MTKFEEIFDYLKALTCHVFFEYNGKQCGIDPLSHTEFDVWYGDKIETFTSIEDVFAVPFFDGKSLKEIFAEIDLDW